MLVFSTVKAVGGVLAVVVAAATGSKGDCGWWGGGGGVVVVVAGPGLRLGRLCWAGSRRVTGLNWRTV